MCVYCCSNKSLALKWKYPNVVKSPPSWQVTETVTFCGLCFWLDRWKLAWPTMVAPRISLGKWVLELFGLYLAFIFATLCSSAQCASPGLADVTGWIDILVPLPCESSLRGCLHVMQRPSDFFSHSHMSIHMHLTHLSLSPVFQPFSWHAPNQLIRPFPTMHRSVYILISSHIFIHTKSYLCIQWLYIISSTSNHIFIHKGLPRVLLIEIFLSPLSFKGNSLAQVQDICHLFSSCTQILKMYF